MLQLLCVFALLCLVRLASLLERWIAELRELFQPLDYSAVTVLPWKVTPDGVPIYVF